ncbi:MAG TPA: TetR/AcrR family transcriptional regulator [Pedobacter sp.]|nr:TetR/AcrR family transcriptional regulator [Pedobacter sp.]
MKFVPRSESTRQFIIEATAKLFNKKGFAGTSLSDLEKATSLTKGSIYGNFENKEQVALAVFDYNIANLHEKLLGGLEGCTGVKEKLMAYLSSYAGFEAEAGGCPMQNTGVEADDTHEPLRQRAAESMLAWIRDITDLIAEGIESGEFKPGTNAHKTALTFFALIEGGILLGRTTKDSAHFKTVLDSAAEYIEGIYRHS